MVFYLAFCLRDGGSSSPFVGPAWGKYVMNGDKDGLIDL